MLLNFLAKCTVSKRERTYTMWSEKSKEAFDKEFGRYIKQDFGYPSKYLI